MTLETLTQNVRARAGELRGLNAKVKFDLGDAGVVMIDSTSTPPAISNEAEDADCTIRLSAADFQKLMEGSLNPTLAYTLGRLKINGSLTVAMRLAALLED